MWQTPGHGVITHVGNSLGESRGSKTTEFSGHISTVSNMLYRQIIDVLQPKIWLHKNCHVSRIQSSIVSVFC